METTRTVRKSPIKNTSFNSGSKSIKNDTRYENLTKQMLDLQYQLAEYVTSGRFFGRFFGRLQFEPFKSES